MATTNAPRPIIVKKIIVDGHGGHHGGAWKVAYADFVTAMMAFFLLMWLLGATTEKQRKALADYFAPTMVPSKQDTAGGSGLFGGDSIISTDKYPHKGGQTGSSGLTIPRDAKGGPREASGRENEKKRFEKMKENIERQLKANGVSRAIARNIRFTETRDGMRIDMVDEANFAMFTSGTANLTPDAITLLAAVAQSIRDIPNLLIIRGHTDSMPYKHEPAINNWGLSAARAESTRKFLAFQQVNPNRFARIEGVADREPYNPKDTYDPRNRRMSITLGWTTPPEAEAPAAPVAAPVAAHPAAH